MWFSKKEPQSLEIQTQDAHKQEQIVWAISSELQNILRLNGFTKEDMQKAKQMYPVIQTHAEEVLNLFFEEVKGYSNLVKIVMTFSSLEKLRSKVGPHVLTMFEGKLDEEYIQKRVKVGKVHVKIGLRTQWYIAGISCLQRSIYHVLEREQTDKEQLESMKETVAKLLRIEEQLVLLAYEEEISQASAKRGVLKDKAKSTTEQLATLFEEIMMSLDSLKEQSNGFVQIGEEGYLLSQRAEQVSTKGKEELQQQIVRMDTLHDDIKKITNETEELTKATKRIEGVISLIKNVAHKTNLLALNASIEAARSGEAGKGFSVVAEEVKKLSSETAASLQAISEMIKETDRKTEMVSNSIERISESIETGARSMGEMHEHFEEIHRSMRKSSAQNETIKEEIKRFSSQIKEVSEGTEYMMRHFSELNHTINEV